MQSNIIIYQNKEGSIKIDVRLEDETVWLTQKMLAQLFDVEVHTINYHLKEIFNSGELEAISTIRKNRIVQKEGNRENSFKKLENDRQCLLNWKTKATLLYIKKTK